MSEDKTQGHEPDSAPIEGEEPTAEAPAEEQPAAEQAPAEEPTATAGDSAPIEEDLDEDEEPTPRVKPLIPGADLEVDIVREGEEALRGENLYGEYDEEAGPEAAEGEEDLSQ